MLRHIIRKVIEIPFIYSANKLLLLACQELSTMQALRFQQQQVESPYYVLYSHVLWSCYMQNRYILFVPNLQITHKDLLKVHCRFFFFLVQKLSCSPRGRKELDTAERLHFHFSLSCIGEGNGNPLQCSCLENPRDGGAWWAAIYGVAQSRT